MAPPSKFVRIAREDARRLVELAETHDNEGLADAVMALLAPLAVRTPRKPTVVSAKDFIEAGNEILGDKFVTPDVPGATWYARLVAGLKAGGVVDRASAEVLLRNVASWATGPIQATTIAAKSGEWLPMARAKGKAASAADDRYARPLDMEV